MAKKIDLSNSSWDKQTFLDDVRNTQRLIIDLLASLPSNADTSSVSLFDVGDTLRFLTLLQEEAEFDNLEMETK